MHFGRKWWRITISSQFEKSCRSSSVTLRNGGSNALFRLRSFLSCLLPALDHAFSANAAKNQPNTEPLHTTEVVSEPDNAQHHREHFSRHGDGD